MEWDEVPLSQLANDAFGSFSEDPNLERTDFSGQFLGEKDDVCNGLRKTAELHGSTEAVHRARPSHGKLFNDPIHGAFRLSPEASLIFDTRQFQRLRRLKQLGMAYYVFPGASHNRFEHSLGTAHLAHKFAFKMWSQQRNDLDIDRWDLILVELAGLCHDLGHGPFSHMFENEFLRQSGITTWGHEQMSADMVDFIVDENSIEGFEDDHIKRIKELITSSHNQSPGGRSGRKWLREIVANGRNSIDVDKFDYLQRDSYYCGRKVSCDFDRIIQFSKVIGDEICYKYTEYMNLYELFHSRAAMHRYVYTHKKSKAIEFMVVDALLEANRAFKIVDKIWNPADFMTLDDGIIDLIENFDLVKSFCTIDDDGDEKAIGRAQDIIRRLRKRDLYKYVTDAPIPLQIVQSGNFKVPTSEDIVAAYRGPSEFRPRAEDVIVRDNKINFAMKDRNPLDQVHFFDSLDAIEKRKLRPEQISSMVVAAYEERQLRVYTRNSDPHHVAAVHEAFERWVKERLSVQCSTPAKAIAGKVRKSAAMQASIEDITRRRKLF